MKHGLRKLALTAHITLAVGWIGAVLAYLVLVTAAIASKDLLTLRVAWLAMELIGWYLIVPLAITSFLTGLVMAAGTRWGVLRHYWVVASLVLTAVATGVLLQHMPTVSGFARIASDLEATDLAALRAGLGGELLHAGVGLVVLLTIEALNVFKPAGMTVYGRRTEGESARSGVAAPVTPGVVSGFRPATPRWVPVLGLHAVAAVLLLVIVHLARGGMSHN